MKFSHSSFFTFLHVSASTLLHPSVVTLLHQCDVDKPNSDEDEEDEPQGSSVSMMQAVLRTEQLESFAFANPDMSNAEQMLVVGNIRCDLQQKRQAKMRQGKLQSVFGAR
jgi:hypothetical protein